MDGDTVTHLLHRAGYTIPDQATEVAA